MHWVGLTGGIGTGKSTVSEMLRSRGVPVLDADQLARLALSPGQKPYEQVIQWLGPSILNPPGIIDRAQLGQIIFQDEASRLRLESLIHPFIQERVSSLKAEFEEEGHDLAVYDIPLLFEKNLSSQFDHVLLVYCPKELQREHLAKREGWSASHIEDRLNAQLDIEFKKSKADSIISNVGTLPELEVKVDQWLIWFLSQNFSKN